MANRPLEGEDHLVVGAFQGVQHLLMSRAGFRLRKDPEEGSGVFFPDRWTLKMGSNAPICGCFSLAGGLLACCLFLYLCFFPHALS